jgi:uncharacterized protein YjiS (DUF1127 family)
MSSRYCIDTIGERSLVPGLPSWRQWLALGVRKAARDARAAVLRLELWAERHDERRRLLAMDARMRHDIGLSDADVWAEARKPFWRA